MKKILVLAPHADDEILGCGGYLIHESLKGSDIRICIATIGGENKLQNMEGRKAEFAAVCNVLGAENIMKRWTSEEGGYWYVASAGDCDGGDIVNYWFEDDADEKGYVAEIDARI